MIEMNSLEEARSYPGAEHIECSEGKYKVYLCGDVLPAHCVARLIKPQDHVEEECVPTMETYVPDYECKKQEETDLILGLLGSHSDEIRYLKAEICEMKASIFKQFNFTQEMISELASIKVSQSVTKSRAPKKPWWNIWG